MIDLEAGRALLDMGSRIGQGHRAEEQLRGAVAVHNILRKHRIAYLADEVGMGKTYVALGALALFRHYQPDFRVLVIAPRENIQKKWLKELTNFAAHNVKFDDLRMRSLDGRPARPLIACANLIDFVTETSLDPNRDFFLRLTSFSLPLGGTDESWKATRDRLRRQLPWLPDGAFDLRNKEGFKHNFARAVCCALPKFDLVIVDEAHNLKHGLGSAGSTRNKVLASVMGHPKPDPSSAGMPLPGYGPRADRVLFLSATPLEETYRHIWNQLDVFGHTAGFDELQDDNQPEPRKKEVAAKFLVRRVTSIHVDERDLTKNQYRREWRQGGVKQHDKAIEIVDDRQRLVVALVQKKVSELLGGGKFKRSFQIGMLASFESFLVTAKLKRDDDEIGTFDDSEQTDDKREREGIDVDDVNRLAKSYRSRFNTELPHPKMDAVVDSVASAWTTGHKSLIFVRRVASVKELKRKLDDRYDDWIISSLRERLPEALRESLREITDRYRSEKSAAEEQRRIDRDGLVGPPRLEADSEDAGGIDTFFAWFFRGDGPRGILSGANVQARFIKASGAYATFFSDNYVMDLLAAEPGSVMQALADKLGLSLQDAVAQLRSRARKYLSGKAKVARANRMEAAQAAALEMLRDQGSEDQNITAGVLLDELYRTAAVVDQTREAPPELADALERPTFFTELRGPKWQELRASIWPAAAGPLLTPEDRRAAFREQALRAHFLATAARLGHAFIDLYVAAMAGRSTIDLRGAGTRASGGDDTIDDEQDSSEERLLEGYLEGLDSARKDAARTWGAFDELSQIAQNFELILDVNAADVRGKSLGEFARYAAGLLRQQQPTGGMFGQVNQTLVRQFRMPGYPFILISTDLLQEGEDLHTFCSSIQHYGISWTPSAMEQRIGRIDRVRSLTDRSLSALDRAPTGSDLLQVHYPFLQDTVEVLQVERVLERMNMFLRLMHEGLSVPKSEERAIDVSREIVSPRLAIPAIKEPLTSAFPIPDWATKGSKSKPAVEGGVGARLGERFRGLPRVELRGVTVNWAPHPAPGSLLGTASLPSGRVQPFTLLLRSDHGHAVVRCISPIGRTHPDENRQLVVEQAALHPSRVGAIPTKYIQSYDLTVEDDVLLGTKEHDAARVAALVRRVTEQADQMERETFGADRDAHLQQFEQQLAEDGASAD